MLCDPGDAIEGEDEGGGTSELFGTSEADSEFEDFESVVEVELVELDELLELELELELEEGLAVKLLFPVVVLGGSSSDAPAEFFVSLAYFDFVN